MHKRKLQDAALQLVFCPDTQDSHAKPFLLSRRDDSAVLTMYIQYTWLIDWLIDVLNLFSLDSKISEYKWGIRTSTFDFSKHAV